MTILVPVALFGWIPLILLLFLLLPPRRAVIVAFIGAWLFLPMAGYSIAGLPDFTKMTATSYGAMLGVVLFDAARLIRFRPSWIDIPIVVYCAVPMASSLTNDLGIYDGTSAVVGTVITWGIPYFIGRLYFSDLAGLRELAIGIFVGGLVYVPLCLYEIRMSPQLHTIIYGFHQHSFAQTKRFGGWRPTVFMQHGLMVGMWMVTASLIGVWLWRAKTLRQIRGVPMALLVPVLLATTILCKSFGALVLLVGGLGALFAANMTRSRVAVWCLILVIPVYLVARIGLRWDGAETVDLIAMVNDERAGSFATRLENEVLLVEKAMQRPVFGWGGWSRNRVYDDSGRNITITDSLWIIVLGRHGLVGLTAYFLVLLLPVIRGMRLLSADVWGRSAFAPIGVLAVALTIYACDKLLNGMPNPLFMLIAGGLGAASVAASSQSVRTVVGLSCQVGTRVRRLDVTRRVEDLSLQ